MNNNKKEILEFIDEYEAFRKNNPLKETEEIIDFGTEIFENNSYYHIDWYFKYGDAQIVNELPTLYSITIDITDIIENSGMYSANPDVGFVISIEPQYFVKYKQTLIDLFNWVVQNYNSVSHDEIWDRAKSEMESVRQTYQIIESEEEKNKNE